MSPAACACPFVTPGKHQRPRKGWGPGMALLGGADPWQSVGGICGQALSLCTPKLWLGHVQKSRLPESKAEGSFSLCLPCTTGSSARKAFTSAQDIPSAMIHGCAHCCGAGLHGGLTSSVANAVSFPPLLSSSSSLVLAVSERHGCKQSSCPRPWASRCEPGGCSWWHADIGVYGRAGFGSRSLPAEPLFLVVTPRSGWVWGLYQ